jgi:Zn-dependent oligopeptidase
VHQFSDAIQRILCRECVLSSLYKHGESVTKQEHTRQTLGRACEELAEYMDGIGVQDVQLQRLQALLTSRETRVEEPAQKRQKSLA